MPNSVAGMAYRCALSTSLAAAIVMAGVPGSASAQCRLCSTPTTERSAQADGSRLELEVSAMLDFDRLVLLGSGNGAATLLPSGERSASGTVATVSGRAMVGSVTVRGEPGRAVRVELPGRIDLYTLGGSRIAIDSLETDLPAMPRLDSAGNLSFRFGGRLTIAGDAEGDYRGEVPVTVEYL